MSEQQEKFIGPHRVLGISKEEGFTTPSGGEIVRVAYETGESQIMPLKSYEALVTAEATDHTSLGDRKMELVRDAIINAIMEYDATAFELQTILQSVSNKISNAYDRAGHVLFNREVYGDGRGDRWVPGTNFSHYRTLLECDIILKKVDKNSDVKDTSDK